jgi:hypothetical protein
MHDLEIVRDPGHMPTGPNIEVWGRSTTDRRPVVQFNTLTKEWLFDGTYFTPEQGARVIRLFVEEIERIHLLRGIAAGRRGSAGRGFGK